MYFPSSAAGRAGLLQAGERQEELQESIKALHNSDKFEDCPARNKIQFSSERYIPAGFTKETGRRVLYKKAVG